MNDPQATGAFGIPDGGRASLAIVRVGLKKGGRCVTVDQPTMVVGTATGEYRRFDGIIRRLYTNLSSPVAGHDSVWVADDASPIAERLRGLL